MSGIPLLFGFTAKEAAYEAVYDSGLGNAAGVLGGILAGSALTLAYSLRLVWGAFVTPHRRAPREPADGVKAPEEVEPPSLGFLLPGAVLAAFTVVLGLIPGTLDRLISTASSSLDARVEPLHLALWHGVTTPLALSAIPIGLGPVVFLRPGRRSEEHTSELQ